MGNSLGVTKDFLAVIAVRVGAMSLGVGMVYGFGEPRFLGVTKVIFV